MSLEKVIVTVSKDGKQKEKFVANYPHIRTLQGFLKGQWDLSIFSDCFTGRNELGDVDATIELNGHTLVLEFKQSKRAMNRGQVLKAIRQAKYSNITTYFIFGDRNKPEAYIYIKPSDNQDGFIASEYIEADLKEIKKEIVDWRMYTEENKLVKSKTEEWEKVRGIMSKLYKG